MKSLFFTVFSLLCFGYGTGQTLIWSEDFENSASDWDLSLTPGTNGTEANIWEMNDNEGGVAPPGCGVANNGDKTLHVTCAGASCMGTGALYTFGGVPSVDATTDIRAALINPINTTSQSNLELVFDWIGVGQSGQDLAELEYSVDGGLTWNSLWSQTPGNTCGLGQGEWKEETVILPPVTENIAVLRLAFHWINDNDGTGTNPSFAVNNLRLFADNALPPTASFIIDSSSVCQGDCISFTDISLGNPTSWQWTFEGGTPSTSTEQNPSNICFDSSGVYSITLKATNANGTDQIVNPLNVHDLPEIIGYGDTTIDMGGAADLEAVPISAGNVFWSPDENIDCPTCLNVVADPLITTTYYPSIIDPNGCIGRDTVVVKVNFEEIVEVPSAFSPNGDGVNDSLHVLGVGLVNINFKVYNRYGQMVFSTDNINKGWDGTMDGKPLNQGVFAYTLKYDLINGTHGEKSGNVTLVK